MQVLISTGVISTRKVFLLITYINDKVTCKVFPLGALCYFYLLLFSIIICLHYLFSASCCQYYLLHAINFFLLFYFYNFTIYITVISFKESFIFFLHCHVVFLISIHISFFKKAFHHHFIVYLKFQLLYYINLQLGDEDLVASMMIL